MKIVQGISGVKTKYVKTIWFEQINSGTSGTITPPEHGEILLNEWAGGVDAVTSTLSTGLPTYDSAETSGGTVITASMDVSGNWTISGTPSAYPICIIYAYRIQLIYFDSTKSLLGDVVAEGGTSGDLEDILQTDIDLSSAGLISGGVISVGTVGKVNISAGVGRAWNGSKFVRVTWNTYTNYTVPGTGMHYVRFNYDGTLEITNTVTPVDPFSLIDSSHVFIGYFWLISPAVLVNVLWNNHEWVGNYSARNNKFLGSVFGTLVSTGFMVTEQSNPDYLKLSISAGTLFHKLNEFSYGIQTTFYKLLACSDYFLIKDTINDNNTIDTTLWNDATEPAVSALKTMTDSYWAKAMIAISLNGDCQYIYPQAEYATEDSAKAAPLPLFSTLWIDANAMLATIVFQKNDTTISDGITDIRPIFSNLLSSISGEGGVISYNDLIDKPDHNDLLNIQGGQANQYYHLNSENYINITQYASQFSNYLTTQSIQTQNIINAVSLSGNNTLGVMTVISSGSLYMAGGNNITLSQDGNSISVVGGAGGGGVAIAGSGASTVTNGTLQFANLNGLSFGLNGSTMTGSHNALMTSASSLLQHTSATSAITANAYATSASSLFDLTANNSLLLRTSQSSLFQHTSATSAITANAYATSASSLFDLTANNSLLLRTSQSSLFQHTSATSVVTASAMNTNERVSFVYKTNLAASNSLGSFTFQTLNFSNANNVTWGTSAGSIITASVAAPGAAAEANQMNLSGNVAGNTTASGSTINWVGGNNITLSGLNNSQIRIDAAAGGGGFTKSIKFMHEDFIGFNLGSGASSHGTQYFFSPLHMDSPISISNVWLGKFMSITSGSSSNSSGRQSYSYVHSLYLFKRDNFGTGSTNLSYYTSASYGFSGSRSHTSNNNSVTCAWVTDSTGGTSTWSTASAGLNFSSYFSGLRFFAVPLVTSLSQGEWFVAHRHSSTSGTVNSNATLFTINNLNWTFSTGVGYIIPLFGTNSTLSNPFHGIGFGSASAITTNATMPATAISAGGSLQMQHGVMVNMGVS